MGKLCTDTVISKCKQIFNDEFLKISEQKSQSMPCTLLSFIRMWSRGGD